MINEHDKTKSMLEALRATSSNHKSMINENENDVIDLNDAEFKEEKNKFMDIVNPAVQFNSFKIYPTASNVVFSGKFDNGIDWQFSKKGGLYFNSPNMELTDEVLETLKRLAGYYATWNEEWSKKLNTEYRGNVEG